MKSLLVIVLFALLTLVIPVMAQEPTQDASAPVATVEPTAPAETQPSADPAIALKWWQVLAGLASAFGIGGVVGIAGVGTIAQRVRNDAATMAAIEGLAKSVPADVAKMALSLARSGEAIAGVVEEAFDDIPAATKTVTTTTVSGASPAG